MATIEPTDELLRGYARLLRRAYAEPHRRATIHRQLGKLTWHTPGYHLEPIVVGFVDSIATTADARDRLREMFVALHRRPSLLPEPVPARLGIVAERDALLAAVRDAFPIAPRIGAPIGEAYLRDEEGFRAVAPAEYDEARAHAEAASWQAVPDAELAHAFAKNSVFCWLDATAIAFYLPTALCYLLREPASNCESYTCMYLEDLARDRRTGEWSAAQRRVIADLLGYLARDGVTRAASCAVVWST